MSESIRDPGERRRQAWAAVLPILVFSAWSALAPSPCRAGEDDKKEVTNSDCFDCHGQAAAADEGHAPIVSEKTFADSGHSDLECVACHDDAADLPHDDDLKEVSLDKCTDCHEDEVNAYNEGSHAKARQRGLKSAPNCDGCHGSIHAVVGGNEKDPGHWAQLTERCAHCHADAKLAAELNLSVVRPVEAYLKSAHARAVNEGKHGAVCSDCHEPHRTLPPDDPKSSIWPAKVPETCGKCHKEILEKFQRSVHGQALARGVSDAPGCTDCHGEHRILSHADSDSPVFSTNVPAETCGRCHSNSRLVERHGMPANFSAFQDSFHGLALRAGEVEAANCASCHGVHDVLPSSDPRSTVNADNLAATCARCHPGAGERFAVGPVHVSAATNQEGLVYWIGLVYQWLIVVVIGGMLLHNLADILRKASRRETHHGAEGADAPERMPHELRGQHILVMLSFPLLAWSGFALTRPESWWAAPLLHLEATYAARGVIHRFAATILVASVLWHVGGLALSRRHREWMRGMWWTLGDIRHVGAMLAYLAGRREERPRSARFSYIEKAEYWAFLWGMVLMAMTGFPLWFADTTLKYLPKWLTDVATAIHFWEAVLATLAILVWHMYWVVFDPDVYPMDMSWWTGKAPPARNAERDDPGCRPPAGDDEQAE